MLFTFMTCISNTSLLHLVCQAILFIIKFFMLKMKCVYYLYMFKLLFSEYFLLASHLIARQMSAVDVILLIISTEGTLDQLREK